MKLPTIYLEDDYAAMARRGGEIVADIVRRSSRLVVALPTGSTSVGLYADLVRRHREDSLSFRHVITFNLDEYRGIPKDDPESYHVFMNRNLFDHLDIPVASRHLPDPLAASSGDEVRRYEEAIDAAGGIDLAVLGVGANGHIAFNEPGDYVTGPTHVAALTDDTWTRNFPSLAPLREQTPEVRARYATAYTVGVGTILRARRILLLASGQAKASVLASAVRGSVTPNIPASFLQLHPDVTMVLDRAAGDWSLVKP